MMKLKYLVMAVLVATSQGSLAARVDVLPSYQKILDCGAQTDCAGKPLSAVLKHTLPPMQVKIAWVDGDGASPPVPPPNLLTPPPPPAPSAPPAPPSGDGSSSSAGAGGTGGAGGGQGGGGPGGKSTPPTSGPTSPPDGAPPQGSPDPKPEGVPTPETVLLDLLPVDDDPGDTLPAFFAPAAFIAPPGNDAVITAVSEPGLLALLGVALVGLAQTKKRRLQA